MHRRKYRDGTGRTEQCDDGGEPCGATSDMTRMERRIPVSSYHRAGELEEIHWKRVRKKERNEREAPGERIGSERNKGGRGYAEP